MAQTKVLIVDDHPIMRRGLHETLSGESDLHICGEAADFDEALDLAREHRPDLAILDISLPSGSGLDLAKQLLMLNKDLHILFVSMHDDAVYAERALRAGALGFINKSRSGAEMLNAIRKVARGEIALCTEIAQRLMHQGIRPDRAPRTGMESLTDRELEVFELIGRGLGTREIADRLSLSTKTIETYRDNIKRKLGIASASELSHHAALWGSEQT